MVRANHRERVQRIPLRRVKIHADSLDFSSISDICIRNTSGFQSREDECMSITMSAHHVAVSSKLHYTAERENHTTNIDFADRETCETSDKISREWRMIHSANNDDNVREITDSEKATAHFIEFSPYAVDSTQYNTSNLSSYREHTLTHTFSVESGIFFSTGNKR